jgi:hypothetical protein
VHAAVQPADCAFLCCLREAAEAALAQPGCGVRRDAESDVIPAQLAAQCLCQSTACNVWIQKLPSRHAAAAPAAAAAQKVGVRNLCTNISHGTTSLHSLLRSAGFDRLNIQLTADYVAAWVLWVCWHPVVGSTNTKHPILECSKVFNSQHKLVLLGWTYIDAAHR